jgi:flagellar motor switch protein FliM
MAERQLTLHEIDELMALFKGGRRASDRPSSVEHLDLNNPTHIPKGILETLTIRHEQASRTMSQSLRTVLRRDIAVTLSSLAQDLFGTFKESLEEPCCAFVLEAPPLRYPGYLVLDHGFAFACLDRLLGGPGEESPEGRELTPTEAAVLGDVLQPIVQAHAALWQRYLNVTLRVVRSVSVPRFLRDVRSNDHVLVASYRAAGFAEGRGIRFAMPLPGLETHLQASRRKEAIEVPVEKKPPQKNRLNQHVGGLAVDVGVNIGSTPLRVREVLALERGDVVVLDRKIGQKLDLIVAGRPKFAGWLQRRGEGMVFRVGAAGGEGGKT